MPRPKLLIATHNPGKVREYCALLGDVPFDLVSLSDAGINEAVDETGTTFEDNARLKAQAYAAASGLTTLADDSGLEVDALGGQPGVRSARYGEDASAEKGSLNLSDQDRVTLLLRNLDRVPWDRRTARFRCVIAVANPHTPKQSEAHTPCHSEAHTPCHSEAHTPCHSEAHTPCHSEAHTPCHSEERSDEESKTPIPQPNTTAQDKNPASQLTFLEGTVEGVIQYEPMGNNGFGYDPVFYLPSYGLTMAQLTMEEKNRISHRAQAAQKAVALLRRWHGPHQEGQ